MRPLNLVDATVEREGLIAVIRIVDVALAVDAALVLADAGITVLEFSLATSPVSVIKATIDQVDENTVVGAGTVLTVSEAEKARDAGASILISPNLDLAVVDWAAKAGILHLPGVFSPTEALLARSAGAPMMKLFPAGLLGPRYIRELLAPAPDLRLVPTGGVNLDNLAQFLSAGAVAAGVGSALINSESARNLTALRDNAIRFRNIAEAVKTRDEIGEGSEVPQ